VYICLMRHGKAEPLQAGAADRSRELTAQGKKQAQTMIQTARQWWPAGKTVLWSSPYVRACQTALYFNSVIPYESFHTHEAIAGGILESVYTDILCSSDANVLCIVGHSPYLDQWVRQWTGMTIDFKPGSMALLDYDAYGGPAGAASLLLYMQPNGAALFAPQENRR